VIRKNPNKSTRRPYSLAIGHLMNISLFISIFQPNWAISRMLWRH